MAQKKITIIEGLAELIHETMGSNEDIRELRTEMNQKFEGVEARLGRIENLLLEEQKWDIESLKARVKRLEDALAV